MRRFFAGLLLLTVLFSLVGCNALVIHYDGNAVLKFQGTQTGDNTKITQTLTEEETNKVKTYLTAAKYSPGTGGCPFHENISITFDDQVFAVAYDGCYCIWLVGSDKYYTLSKEGYDYIISLFEKYVGKFF
ncbi:MAG: hypothetical protein J6A88_03095 [Oscillospiraceae bacterium]|nr:hypothetical protein [Oscillospiraceae bacterium]